MRLVHEQTRNGCYALQQKKNQKKQLTLNQRRNHVDHPKGLQVTFLKSDEFGADPDSPVARQIIVMNFK